MSHEHMGPPPLPANVKKHFDAFVGSWDCDVTFAPGAPMPPMKGVEKNTLACGGYWMLTDVDAHAGDAPFTGHGMAGYDAARRKFTTYWADSMGGPLQSGEGEVSADGKSSTAIAETFNPVEGGMVRVRQVHTHVDAKSRTFVTFGPGPDGKETAIMTIRYRRRA